MIWSTFVRGSLVNQILCEKEIVSGFRRSRMEVLTLKHIYMYINSK